MAQQEIHDNADSYPDEPPSRATRGHHVAYSGATSAWFHRHHQSRWFRTYRNYWNWHHNHRRISYEYRQWLREQEDRANWRSNVKYAYYQGRDDDRR